MNLHRMLAEREEEGRPVGVGLIGAGKFGTMYLAQARLTRGVHLVGIADIDIPRARASCALAGWPEAQYSAESLDAAAGGRSTFIGDDAGALMAHPGVEVVITSPDFARRTIMAGGSALDPPAFPFRFRNSS